MNLIEISAASNQGYVASSKQHPKTPEEAAKQFEEILIKQFVKTMTDGMFESSLAGEDEPQWLGAYGDIQKETLTEQLAKHIVESGSMRISDLLLKQWGRQGRLPNTNRMDAGTPPENESPI